MPCYNYIYKATDQYPYTPAVCTANPQARRDALRALGLGPETVAGLFTDSHCTMLVVSARGSFWTCADS